MPSDDRFHAYLHIIFIMIDTLASKPHHTCARNVSLILQFRWIWSEKHPEQGFLRTVKEDENSNRNTKSAGTALFEGRIYTIH